MPVMPIAPSGGTPAPSARQQAAKRAAKPPRIIGVHPQRITGGGRGRGRAPRAATSAKASNGRGGAAFNPISGFLNSKQLGHLAQEITRANMRTQIAPLRQQAKEIGGTESTVSSRYAGYSDATNQMLQGIGQDATAQAKTYENQAADAALKAGQQINQTGQSAVAQNGGYLDPQVQAELNAEGKLAAGTGAAQNSFAASSGGNEQSFMGNLRAAAAQRALEAQHGISTQYGQQLGKNQAEQDRLIAKQPSEAKSLATTLGQQQFTDYATMKGLGIKQATVNIDGQKVKLTAQQNQAKDRLTERGQNITASRNAAQIRLDERKLAETERHNRASEQVAAEKARAEVKKASGGLTTNEQDRLSGQIGTAYNIVQQMRSGTSKHTPQEIRNTLTTGSRRGEMEVETSTGKKYWKAVTYKYPKVAEQPIITAAIELWYHHKVSASTAKALTGLGVKVPPGWTNGSFKGF